MLVGSSEPGQFVVRDVKLVMAVADVSGVD